MDFEIIGEITNIERMAVNQSIREIRRLNKKYGKARWRKLKSVALAQLTNGEIFRAEIHWYEAHGIMKIKRVLD